MKTKVTWLVLFSILSLVSAGTVYAIDLASYSGFLKHYPDLKPDPNFKGAHKWTNPKIHLSKYDKGMIAPLEVWIAPNSKYKGLAADQIAVLNSTYQAIISDVMEPDFPIVNKPGKGVILLRIALTNVKIKERKKGFAAYLPPALILRGVDKAFNESLRHLVLQEAVFEGQAVDSITGEVIGVRMVVGKELESKGLQWEGLKDFIRYRTKQFRDDWEKTKPSK